MNPPSFIVYFTPYTTVQIPGSTSINFLTSTQLPDGSWNDDPYSTALALRALYYSENKPVPLPQPTTGIVTGTIIDASTNQPLGNVSVSVVSNQSSASTTTDNTGHFSLSGIAAGVQQVSFSLNGYAPSSATVTITAGSITNLGTIPLSSNPSAGIIKGTVTDASNGQPLAGATIQVTGSYAASVMTGSDGSFTITDVTPGAVTITASKPGYYPITSPAAITAGGLLFFNPQLSTTPPTSTTGSLIGKVLDSVTGNAIQGATITLTGGLSASTDATGSFSISDITPNTYQVGISAAGYASQNYQVMIMAGVTTDMQTINLGPSPQSTSVTGKVTDSTTGMPVAGASVTIAGTSLSATADTSGTYTLSGVTLSAFTIKASATGYNSKSLGATTNTYGHYTIDFSLDKSISSDIKITAISTDKQTYSINENIAINATIQNTGTAAISGLVTAEIQDSAGKVIANTSPSNPNISLAPASMAQITMTWNTGQFSPGAYNIVVKVAAPLQIGYPTAPAALLGELFTIVSIEEGKAIMGSISPTPPVTQANMQMPIAIKAAIRNTGNVPITAIMTLTAAFNGSTIYTMDTAVTSLQVNSIMEMDLGSFTPAQGGNYTITLAPLDQTIAASISTTLYVGPYATGIFTVAPDKAVAGDARVTGKILLKGIAASTGIVQDPMVPIIKAAIQKGVTWEQGSVMQWQNTYNCNGCHIQAQALVGLEVSRDKVVVDENVTNTLFVNFQMWQNADGSIGGAYGSAYQSSKTMLGLWALISWHDQNTAKPYIIKAADYLLAMRNTDGSWNADNVAGWWGESVSATALSMMGIGQAYVLSNDPKYIPYLTQATQYMTASGRVDPNNNMARAHQIIGLQSVLDSLQEADLRSQALATINSAIQTLKSSQRPDGGWGRYTTYESDSLVTAQVVYAIITAGIPSDDPILHSALQYLLNTQGADGSWYSQNGVLGTRLAATSWVIISLPVALEAVAGVAADLTIAVPPGISVNNFSINPNNTGVSGGDTTYTWNFKGLTDTDKELALYLTLKGLQLGEQRKIASDAVLSFKDSYTGNIINLPIDIPSATGVSPVSIDVATNKTQYTANENVNITAFLANISPEMKVPIIKLAVEDSEGNAVSNIGDFQADAINPLHEPAFLEGWLNRIKLTIDHTKVGENLTDFPVRIHLGAASGINKTDISAIFDELGLNSKKIAVTNSDGVTQYFVEVDRWDYVNKEADLWVRVPAISATENTVFYLYFDATQGDNSSYVGDTNSSTAHNVWNSDYRAVYHMSQYPGNVPLVLDSTGSNNGVAYGSMNYEDSVGGQVGKALAFDGGDDFIGLGTWFNYQTFSIELWANPGTSQVQYADIMDNNHTGGRGWVMQQVSTDTNHFCYGAAYNCEVCFVLTPNQWTNIAVTRDGGSRVINLFINGALSQTCTGSANINYDGSQYFSLGRWGGGGRNFNGALDEVSISNIAHSPGWIKASYYSQTDNLISFGVTESANDIDPASKQTYNFTWNTGSTIAGDYIVRAKLDENGTFLAEDTAGFAVLSDKTLSSKVTTDKISYNPNGQVAITSDITSASPNYNFQNLTANVSIADSQGQNIFTDSKTIQTLMPGQTTELKTYWNTTANPSGMYIVTLEVFEDTTLLSTSTAIFNILGSANTGGGLAGTIIAQPNPVNKGKDELVTFTIINSGNEDIAALNAKIIIVNPDTQETKTAVSSQWSVVRGTTIAQTQTIATANLSPAVYLAILQAATPAMTQPKTLASSAFEVKQPPIEVTKTITYDVKNLLVWINDKESCQHPAFSDQHKKNSNSSKKCEVEEDDYNKDCIRLDLLENILKEAVTDYMIVFDKKDFQKELRNPYYTDILILGDHHNLEDHYGEELREKVYSGTGIVSSLWFRHGHDEGGDKDEDKDEDQIFGISHKVKQSGEYPVITNEYGSGRAAYLAFDFGHSLTDENYDHMSAILGNALSYVHGPLEAFAFRPGQFVPVELELKSLGGAFDLRITETYSPELKLYDPAASLWITDNPWITNIHLDPDETKTLPYYVLSPDKTGTYTIQTEVGYIDNGTYAFFKNLNTNIPVDKDMAAMAGDIIAALNALDVSNKDKAKVKEALKYITNIRTRTVSDEQDIGKNIHDLLKAVGGLLRVESADVSAVRLLIDGLLRAWEGKYYLGRKSEM